MLYNDAFLTNKAINVSYTVHRPIILIFVGIALFLGLIILVKVTSKKKTAQTRTPEQAQIPNIAEIPKTSPTTQFCSGCGQPNLDGGNFCKNCGNKIK